MKIRVMVVSPCRELPEQTGPYIHEPGSGESDVTEDVVWPVDDLVVEPDDLVAGLKCRDAAIGIADLRGRRLGSGVPGQLDGVVSLVGNEAVFDPDIVGSVNPLGRIDRLLFGLFLTAGLRPRNADAGSKKQHDVVCRASCACGHAVAPVSMSRHTLRRRALMNLK
jgi:hypothetical protein